MKNFENDSENITKEILGLEKKYWNAMRDHDLESAISLTDFPCLVAGSHGLQSVDKEQFTKMFNSSEGGTRTFEFDESNVEVRQINPTTAVVAYKVHTSFSNKGESKTIDAVDTSTWIKRDDKWVCAMHTETELVQ